jgi:integrase
VHDAFDHPTVMPPRPRPRRLFAAAGIQVGASDFVSDVTPTNNRRGDPDWTVALGLRQSEALALQCKDIDLLDGRLTVQRTLHQVKGQGLVYEEPKTSRGRGSLAPSPHLVRE